MLYVAYGSNMNRRQMARRCPQARPLAAIRLAGWRLVMKRVADIEPDAQAVTPAALWEITRACERALDAYEGFPHLYIKERITVSLPNGKRAKPMAYVMNGPRQRNEEPHRDVGDRLDQRHLPRLLRGWLRRRDSNPRLGGLNPARNRSLHSAVIAHQAAFGSRSPATSSNVRPSPSRVATLPTAVCQRLTATSTYCGEISTA